MVYEATKVEMSYFFHKVLPKNDPEFIDYEKFRKQFGEDGNVMVLGIKSDNLFEVNQFNSWHQLGEDIKKIDGVKGIISISHLLNIYKDNANKKFDIKPLLTNKIATQQEMDSIKSIILSLQFYEGIIYNKENGATLIAITFDEIKLNSEQRIRVVNEIVAEAKKFSSAHNIEVHYSGLPFIRTTIALKVVNELRLFLVLGSLVTAIILAFFFRSFYVVFFAMLVVAVAVFYAFAVIALMGFKLNILTGLIPPLIIVIVIPNCIFILNKYHDEFRRHQNKIKALTRTVQKTGGAILIINATTAVGCGTFIITNTTILVEFGYVAFLSILITYLISFIFIPIIFSYLPDPTFKNVKHLDNKRIQFIIETVGILVKKHRPKIYISTVIFIMLAIIGLTKIKTLGFIVDDIPKRDQVYIDLKFFEKNFHGVMPFEITVDSKKKGGILKLSALQRIDSLQNIIKKYPEFAKPISIVEFIKFSKQAFYNGNEKYYMLPTQYDQNFILPYLSKVKEKERKIYNLIDSTKQITRISVQMADVGSVRIKEIKDELQSKIDSIFDPDKYNVKLTGTSLVFLKGNSYLMSNLKNSLILAITINAILMFMLFASFRMLIISLIPNFIPLLITAGIMGYFNIHFKPSTILIFSIAFGISVDNTIHFLAKYRQELKNCDWNISESVYNALKEAGVSTIYTSIVLLFGFSIFMVSDFGGTVSLGLLVCITLSVAMFCNLILLPSLLLSLEKAILVKALKEPLFQVYDEEEDIELDNLVIEIKSVNVEQNKT